MREILLSNGWPAYVAAKSGRRPAQFRASLRVADRSSEDLPGYFVAVAPVILML